jgi:hypothetical protein
VFTESEVEYSLLWRIVRRPTVVAGIPIVVGLLIYVWYRNDGHLPMTFSKQKLENL